MVCTVNDATKLSKGNRELRFPFCIQCIFPVRAFQCLRRFPFVRKDMAVCLVVGRFTSWGGNGTFTLDVFPFRRERQSRNTQCHLLNRPITFGRGISRIDARREKHSFPQCFKTRRFVCILKTGAASAQRGKGSKHCGKRCALSRISQDKRFEAKNAAGKCADTLFCTRAQQHLADESNQDTGEEETLSQIQKDFGSR